TTTHSQNSSSQGRKGLRSTWCTGLDKYSSTRLRSSSSSLLCLVSVVMALSAGDASLAPLPVRLQPLRQPQVGSGEAPIPARHLGQFTQQRRRQQCRQGGQVFPVARHPRPGPLVGHPARQGQPGAGNGLRGEQGV